jgi:hypothetical protein
MWARKVKQEGNDCTKTPSASFSLRSYGNTILVMIVVNKIAIPYFWEFSLDEARNFISVLYEHAEKNKETPTKQVPFLMPLIKGKKPQIIKLSRELAMLLLTEIDRRVTMIEDRIVTSFLNIND